jgi:hypothetical protein
MSVTLTANVMVSVSAYAHVSTLMCLKKYLLEVSSLSKKWKQAISADNDGGESAFDWLQKNQNSLSKGRVP